MNNLSLNNPFWVYSLKLYQQPDVEQTCLQLQQQGFDVNLVLLACWLASQGRHWQLDDIQQAVDAGAIWSDKVVKPLRHIRQSISKSQQSSKFREKVKALELEAEQYHQAALYQFSQIASLEEAAIDQNLLQRNLQRLSQHFSAGSVNMSQERMPALYVYFCGATFSS